MLQRTILSLVLVLAFAVVGCDDDKRTVVDPGCDAGFVLVDGDCEKVCATFADCVVGETCDATGICVATSQLPPRILSLDGDSDMEARDPTTAEHRVVGGLVIVGENLTDVVVALDGEAAGLPTYASLTVRPGGTDSRLEVALPVTVAPGSYTLTVTNAAGSDQATATLLEGPPGAEGAAGQDGVCDPTDCTTQALPGVGSIVTVTVQALDRAVVTEALSVKIDGVEQVPTGLATSTAWLAVVDRFTGVLSSTTGHNMAYDAGDDPTAMIQALQAVTETQAVALVTSANGTDSYMFTDPGIGSTIEDELKQLGAGDSLDGTGGQHQMAFVGYRGVVPGGGIFLTEENVSAETALIFADGVPVGARVSDRVGWRIETNEIAVWAVDELRLAQNSVTMIKLADDAVWTNKLNDLAVTNAKLADDAVQTRNIQPDAVDTAAIADGAVTSAKLDLPLTSYLQTTASTTEACSPPAMHTFCALTWEDHRFYVAGTGTHVYCRAEMTVNGWQVCARGDGTTESRCEMTCF